jgi:hypothetical protein
MVGGHAVKTWSSTQIGVSLSSGEAEFYGVLKGAGIGLGFQSMMADLGITLPLRLWTDSSAAIGICSRQGLGKLRHLDTHLLWIQQAVRGRRLDLRKVPGEQNPADLFTKHMGSREHMAAMVDLLNCRYRDGRSKMAPLTRTTNTGKSTIADAELHDVGVAPLMPHLEHSLEELESLYPALHAPQDVTETQEEEWSTWDGIAARGAEIVEDIVAVMSRHGRRRCEEASSSGAQGTEMRNRKPRRDG